MLLVLHELQPPAPVTGSNSNPKPASIGSLNTGNTASSYTVKHITGWFVPLEFKPSANNNLGFLHAFFGGKKFQFS